MLPTPTGGRPPVRCHSRIGPKKKLQWGRATSLGARPPLGFFSVNLIPIFSCKEKHVQKTQHSLTL
ncbi:hypothetical protein CsSME_00002197 [Camellia sinensis var. sinensis]